MNKAEIRPLLVEALVQAQVAEKFKHEGVQKEYGFQLDIALAEWRESRLKRATAELQLWLADRQWEREESEAREDRPTEAPPSASQTTKP